MRVATSTPIVRQRVLSRLERSGARIVVLVAPAGYGKSMLARQYLQTFPASATCDCADVTSDVELARRVLAALAAESPAAEPTFSQAQLVLRGDAGERFDVLLRAWMREPSSPSAFLFENAEQLVAAQTRELLWQLLGTAPQQRTIAICTRTPLAVTLSRFAAPHELAVLRVDDLRFDALELREAFAGTDADDAMLEKVAAHSRGWAIAIFLFCRFEREGRLKDIFSRMNGVEFDTLHDYLAAQVLDPLDENVRSALTACALIPNAAAEDIALALQERSEPRVNQILHGLPFVERTKDGGFTVHPLLAASIEVAHGAERAELLERVAAAWERRGHYLRSAELHRARGDWHATAAALDAMDVLEQQVVPVESAALIAWLDREVILRYPRLWYGSALRRRYSVDSVTLLREAETVWRQRPPGSDPAYWTPALVTLANFLSEQGRHEEALRHLIAFERESAMPDPPTSTSHGSISHVHACVLARMGRLEEARRRYESAAPLIREKNVSYGTSCITRAVDLERLYGNREEERRLLEAGCAALGNTGYPPLFARALAEAAVGAWLAGEDAAYAQAMADLAEAVEREGVRAFAFLVAAAAGRTDAQPLGIESPYWLALGYLVMAANAKTRARADESARAAIAYADAYGAPFPRMLARIALAIVTPHDGERLAAQVRTISESLVPAIDVRQLPASELLARRMRGRSTSAPDSPSLELLAGNARRGELAIALHESERNLLRALALFRHGIASEALLDLLWPDLDVEAGRNRLHVAVHRLRRRLGMRDIVTSGNNTYRLNDTLTVDLWELDSLWSTACADGSTQRPDEPQLRETFERLERYLADTRARPEPEWFEPTRRRLEELAHALGVRFALRAIEAGDFAQSIRRAQALLARDACDEAAWELLIRSHLAAGDRPEGLRQYRLCRDALQRELQAEPNEDIARLLRSPP